MFIKEKFHSYHHRLHKREGSGALGLVGGGVGSSIFIYVECWPDHAYSRKVIMIFRQAGNSTQLVFIRQALI